jgi:uncharacterized protein involved in exopolysaccharide biosynthesis
MADKETYIEKVKQRIAQLDDTIDELRAKASAKTAEFKAEHQEDLDALKLRRDQMNARLQQLIDAGEDRWNRLRGEMESMWDDVRTHVKGRRSSEDE